MFFTFQPFKFDLKILALRNVAIKQHWNIEIYEGCFDETALVDIKGQFYATQSEYICKLNSTLVIKSSELQNLQTFLTRKLKIKNSFVTQLNTGNLEVVRLINTTIERVHHLRYSSSPLNRTSTFSIIDVNFGVIRLMSVVNAANIIRLVAGKVRKKIKFCGASDYAYK